jgi:CheY-like chemotaxis protein
MMTGRGPLDMTNPRTATILVVDDDAVALKLCATHLETAGYTVLTAAGSTEAQDLCDTYPAKIDLIILDLMLYPPTVEIDHHANPKPRVHGDKLVPILRMKRPRARILLVSATSLWTLGGRGMGRLVRQYPFLPKPLTRQVLLEKVQELLATPHSNRTR